MIDPIDLRLMHLHYFHAEAERDCGAAIERLEAQYAGTTTEAWSRDRGDGVTLTDQFIGDREDIFGLLAMKEQFAVMTLYTVFERFLRSTLLRLKRSVSEAENRNAWRIDDLKKEFAGMGIIITEPAEDWNALKKLQAIRNCIAHNDGWIDDESFKRLSSFGFQNKWTYLQLPENYFADSSALIQRMCRKIKSERPPIR